MKKKRRINRRRYPPHKRRLANRNMEDPAYIKWRESVFKRDDYTCQFPHCDCRRHLNAHHILRWSDYPLLRLEVANGITLCAMHHKLVKNKEDQYAQLFQKILSLKLVQHINDKTTKTNKHKS